jgi:hypothetical protein
MSRSRRLPPLFEVMRETTPLSRAGGALRSAASPPPPPAPPSIDDLPRARPATRPEAVGSTGPLLNGPQVLRPVHREDDEDTDEAGVSITGAVPRLSSLVNLNRTYVLPASWVIGGLGVVLALMVAVWAVAHRAGAASERSRLIPSIPAPAGLAGAGEPAGLGGEPLPSASPPALIANNVVPSTGPGSARPATEPPIPRTTGSHSSADDPRQPGYNYLLIQRDLRQDDAEATAAFLTSRGVPSVAFPAGGGRVDRAAADAKNRPQWMVIVREGIASADYRKSTRKDELLQTVKRLGLEWKKNPKGGFDFDSSLWMLYKPRTEADNRAPPR